MKLDIPQKFWKKYIEADSLERDRLLKIPVDNLRGLIDLLNVESLKQKRYKKNREMLMKTFLKSYFDDLIDTFILK